MAGVAKFGLKPVNKGNKPLSSASSPQEAETRMSELQETRMSEIQDTRMAEVNNEPAG